MEFVYYSGGIHNKYLGDKLMVVCFGFFLFLAAGAPNKKWKMFLDLLI